VLEIFCSLRKSLRALPGRRGPSSKEIYSEGSHEGVRGQLRSWLERHKSRRGKAERTPMWPSGAVMKSSGLWHPNVLWQTLLSVGESPPGYEGLQGRRKLEVSRRGWTTAATRVRARLRTFRPSSSRPGYRGSCLA
jgi:hypothetical protein